jgi:hypothetical protein
MADDPELRTLTDAERRLLAAVLDEIVPPEEGGRFPGAGQLGLAGPIDDALRKTPALRAMIVQGLAELDVQARGREPRGFAALPPPDRLALLQEQSFLLPLTFQVFAAYYSAPRVVEALGLEPRPPHPQGYEMAPDDLTLLEAVRRRPRSYRRV